MKKSKLAFGSSVGYVITALFNAILVVAKESNEAFLTSLKTTFGHHWIGHGILVILVFIIATLILMTIYKGEFTDKTAKILTITIIVSTLLRFLIIAGFYITHL
jgi:small-conductance mechanosensitive channel